MGSTPTWCFKIEIYEDPVEVGRVVFNRIAEDVKEQYIEEEFGMSEDAWIEICRTALTDEEAQEEFVERLNESSWS